MQKFKGTIERITYHNNDTNFTVMEVMPEIEKNAITVTATIMDPVEGMCVYIEGEKVTHKIYGFQIKATTCYQCLPSTTHGLWKLLSGGSFTGIGDVWAKRIVERFGEDSIEVLDNTPERLLEIPRFGKSRAESLARQWKEKRSIIDIMVFLQKYGLSTVFAIKIYNEYGDDVIAKIENNPYVLSDDIDGIGFRKADEIALSMGFEKNSPKRICAAIEYVMNAWTDEGNTYCFSDTLVKKVVSLIGVKEEAVIQCIDEMVEYNELIREEHRLFMPKIRRCESNVASHINDLINSGWYMDEVTEEEVDTVEDKLGIKYDEKQREAIKMAIRNPFSIITGGPGTGKTTITKGIIMILEMRGLVVKCAAPTGKAADRMSNATGQEASTIHRMLGYKPNGEISYDGFNNPYPADAIVLDEMSMVNVLLANTLMKALRHDTKIIVIGDTDQLPCIGPGNILSDLISSGECPHVNLEFVFRQGKSSRITLAAYDINEGKVPDTYNSKDSDFFFVNLKNSNDWEGYIVNLVTKRIPEAYGIQPMDVQVISPMKDGICGVNSLNRKLQEAINPYGEHIDFGTSKFRVGDKVMQTKNNYTKDVFNGETGIIVNNDGENRTITVEFKDKEVDYLYRELDELMLSYAITVHKSQGSEYEAVVFPVCSSHHIMLKRNLLYTGITRGKKLCIVAGDRNELQHGASTVDTTKRNTYLKYYLRQIGSGTFVDVEEPTPREYETETHKAKRIEPHKIKDDMNNVKKSEIPSPYDSLPMFDKDFSFDPVPWEMSDEEAREIINQINRDFQN